LGGEEDGHGTWAYDVRLLEACRDLGWKCWSSSPELFHHKDEYDSAITEINGKPLFELKPKDGNTTPNIACGARSDKFLTNEPAAVEQFEEMAKDPALCLKGVSKNYDNPLRGDK
jgi:hypothetical protein